MTTLVENVSAPMAGMSLREPDIDEWTICGQPVCDFGLYGRIVDALKRTGDLPGMGDDVPDVNLRDFSSAEASLERRHTRISDMIKVAAPRGRTANVARLVDALLEVERVRLELSQARSTQLVKRYSDVQAALARLRGVSTIPKMLERAPAELCRCGFDRVVVSRVTESIWHVETCYIEGDPEWAQEIARVGRQHSQRLDHMLLESEMMRRRAPVLVRDAQRDPRTHGAIGAASLCRSYVAAPVMPEGRVIGFLHADCYMSRRHIDEDDLAVLWLFAEGFGYAFQRTVLVERLIGLRANVQGMTRSMDTVMDDVCGAETELAPVDRENSDATSMVAATLIAPESRLETLLTRREVEVLSLMAMGKSNIAIATHLVISEGTVKSHVKHILRKLRAANRAEAVYRFMRLTPGTVGFDLGLNSDDEE